MSLTRLFIKNAITYLIVLFIFRSFFWAIYHNPEAIDSFGAHVYSVFTGLKHDLRLVLLIHFPLFVLAGSANFDPLRRYFARWFWKIYLNITILVVTFLYVLDVSFFRQTESRLTQDVVFAFFDSRDIPLKGVSGYPLMEALLLVILIGILHMIWLRYLFPKMSSSVSLIMQGKQHVGVSYLGIGLFLLGFYGSYTLDPLPLSTMGCCASSFLDLLAANPIMNLLASLQ